MTQLIQASTILNGFPLPKLKKIDRNEGEVVNPLGLSFTWKIKGADTGYAFAVYEMAMAPSAMIPMHIHPFAEYFYVLEGTIDIMGLAEIKNIDEEISNHFSYPRVWLKVLEKKKTGWRQNIFER